MNNTLVVLSGKTSCDAQNVCLPWPDALALVDAIRHGGVHGRDVWDWPIIYGEQSDPEWDGEGWDGCNYWLLPWERVIRVRVWSDVSTERTLFKDGKTYHFFDRHFDVDGVETVYAERLSADGIHAIVDEIAKEGL